MKANRLLLVGAMTLTTPILGCNLFGFMSSPGNDGQYLSVARACLDSGDFACALENYQKLSAAYDDIRLSETSFLTLAQNGMTMGVFMEAFGNGEGGSGIRVIANHLAANANQTTRLAIFGAYSSVDGNTANGEIANSSLKGFVRFVVSLALAGEILAEDADAVGAAEFTSEDFTIDPTACRAAGTGACATTGGCDKPAAATMTDTAATFTLNDSDAGTSTGKLNTSLPDLKMFHAAIVQVDAGLTAAQAGGKYGTGTGGFASQMITAATAIGVANSRCYRQSLLSQGL
ncbi:MAG: hypothetical protein AB7P04_07690 [Bacteriovoracia bacterium]